MTATRAQGAVGEARRSADLTERELARRLGISLWEMERLEEGEIDLVAWDGDVLVFVEVKSRTSSDLPESAVGFKKRSRVIRAAHAYIARYHLQRAPYRFDIVTVNETPTRKPEYRLIRAAFRVHPEN